MAKQTRDNGYYRERLKAEHPAIYADLLAGRYRSDSEAIIAAGIKKRRTRLMELKNAWDKATSVERAEFMRHAGLAGRTAPPVSTGGPARPIFTQSHSFEPAFAAWLEAEMDDRGMKPGQLMKILGASTHDQSVSMALSNDTCLHNQSLRQALSQWASANGWR